jgi:hypothetical protein
MEKMICTSIATSNCILLAVWVPIGVKQGWLTRGEFIAGREVGGALTSADGAA